MRRLCIIACCVIVLSVSCNNTTGSKELELKKDDTLSQVKPEKPVMIKLKRKDNGKYSWEIKGDDAEKIMEADEKLRNYTTNSKEEK
jgi:predicted secreted protein